MIVYLGIMVLAERNNDVRNGKRSRGPSPNGHGSPDSSSDDENGMFYHFSKVYLITIMHWKIITGCFMG